MKQQPLTKDLQQKARIMDLAGDPVRIRILCALFEQSNVCVSDMAKCLKMSVARVSHHLNLLEQHGLVGSTRSGKNICYAPKTSPLMTYIKQLICHKE